MVPAPLAMGLLLQPLAFAENGVCKRSGKSTAGAGKAEPRETVYFL